jgi:polyisoprenoid-binding protein YceI
MSRRSFIRATLACAFASALATIAIAGGGAQQTAVDAPLTLGATRISIEGTSNIHAYTASTTDVRLTRLALRPDIAGPGALDELLGRDAVQAFEITLPAASVSSPKEGLDKNMHKALRVKEFPNISFRLLRLQPKGTTPDAYSATGVLSVAGVDREIVLDITATRAGSRLTVTGGVNLLMTDFGIAPPKAMLGMLRTDPAVTVRVETALEVPQT